MLSVIACASLGRVRGRIEHDKARRRHTESAPHSNLDVKNRKTPSSPMATFFPASVSMLTLLPTGSSSGQRPVTPMARESAREKLYAELFFSEREKRGAIEAASKKKKKKSEESVERGFAFPSL